MQFCDASKKEEVNLRISHDPYVIIKALIKDEGLFAASAVWIYGCVQRQNVQSQTSESVWMLSTFQNGKAVSEKCPTILFFCVGEKGKISRNGAAGAVCHASILGKLSGGTNKHALSVSNILSS